MLLRDPRREAAEERRRADAGEDEHPGEERAGEAAAEVLPLRHRTAEEERVGVQLEVAVNGVDHERGGGERAEEAHHQQAHHHDVRRVPLHVRRRAEAVGGIAADHGEGHREEDDEQDREQRRFDLVFELERGDGSKHHAASATRNVEK
jgi:hypothetical protein